MIKDSHTYIYSASPEEQSEVDVLELLTDKKTLILHNDDVNTFDFVINSLIEVCKHDPIQAEQCTYLIHFKGKCDVMHGVFEELESPCKELIRRGLSAEIT